jgi:dihydroorotase
MKKQAIINGAVINPNAKTKDILNILLCNKKIAGLGYLPDEDQKNSEIIEAKGKIIIPGIIDMNAHFGFINTNAADTLKSGSLAARQGGITAACLTPDTQPVLDTPETLNTFDNEKKAAEINLFPIAAITKNMEGKQLAELHLLKEAGAVAFSDNQVIDDPLLMKLALEYSAITNLPLIIGPNKKPVQKNGQINEGYYSTILGLGGISNADEEILIERDIKLLATYGGKIHFSHLSTKGAVAAVRKAKKAGLNVTAGTAPQYLYFTEQDLTEFNTNKKVLPPFRAKADVSALIEGLCDGTIDVLSSQHQPMLVEDKLTDFQSASFGISTIDLFLSLILTKLYDEEKMDIYELVKKFTVNPAKILNLKVSNLGMGLSPNLTIVDLKKEKAITLDDIKSKGKNSPFIGCTLKGFATQTVINGEI